MIQYLCEAYVAINQNSFRNADISEPPAATDVAESPKTTRFFVPIGTKSQKKLCQWHKKNSTRSILKSLPKSLTAFKVCCDDTNTLFEDNSFAFGSNTS
uniref:Uncharacterized protein n=1 Tax=Romanomermis culicivorax TaxID=13658 RepID=A0A915J490_ROMCU